MNPQHGSQRIRRATALEAGLGVKWYDQINELIPANNGPIPARIRSRLVRFLAVFCS
jgi:hypothetical protein